MPTKNSTMSEQATAGSAAAIAEVVVNHPFWTMKTRMQTGEPFTMKPNVLYRGFKLNVASMIPITVVQMWAYSVFQSQEFAAIQNPWSMAACAFSAGAIPAVFACPVEMVMTHMKKDDKFSTIARMLMKQGGIQRLYAGFMMTAMRDGVFTIGYMVAPDFIKPKLQPYCETDESAAFWSKVVAGVGAAVVSQPFDTVKTAQQSGKQTWKDAMKNPYKGGFFRGVRVVSAVYIMSKVKDNMDMFFQHRVIAPDSTPDIQKSMPGRTSG